MRAVVAPELCTDVLLGLPWLTCNNIVIDHMNGSCIDKITRFDLMNPVEPPQAPEPKPKLKQIYQDTVL
jgi:hypothetical protein